VLHCNLWLQGDLHRKPANHSQNRIWLWTYREGFHILHIDKLRPKRTCYILPCPDSCMVPKQCQTAKNYVQILKEKTTALRFLSEIFVRNHHVMHLIFVIRTCSQVGGDCQCVNSRF
jgi:hypothetical protein